jgi:hypothetical protein
VDGPDVSGPDPGRRPYVGYRDGDADTPFGRFFDPVMAPLDDDVVRAVAAGPQAPPLFADVGPLDDDHGPVETAFTVHPDGSIRVNVLTTMPGVTPAMWDWWFGWHGCDPRRYKLWHPQAHLWAEWDDGDARHEYVGRTSFVDEYLGATKAKAAIQFRPPTELGIRPADGEVVICARTGASDRPVDLGWLIHHVRPVDGGSEMRSRFWLGGPGIALRANAPAVVGKALPTVVKRVLPLGAPEASALLVHCAQEMSHLAGFLPDLYEAFGDG